MTVLYDGGWFAHEVDSKGLEFLTEPKDGVTILCYSSSKGLFLLLHERMSATGNASPVVCSLTGSIDPGETPRQTALRELAEEAGAVILDEDLHQLGDYVHTYKGCTKKTYMFFAELSGAAFIRATGDGSTVEEQAYVKWHPLQDVLLSADALLLASLARAQNAKLL